VLSRGMTTRFGRDIRAAPNLITLSRIVLTALGLSLFLYGPKGAGIAILIVAGITDYVDGIVARRTGQVTRLGEIFDQFSDLLLESAVLLVSVMAGRLPAVVLFIYLLREFWVVSIRRYMAEARINIPSTIWGKLKSNFIAWGNVPLFVSTAALLPSLDPYVTYLGQFGVGLGLIFGYISGTSYTRAFFAGYEKA
jgi:CDP-diacylglycerol---glycerol-3-phosphate 3-phosphatidyltransferase